MGRGRVQLKRIENKINRQVTFSKRRGGLMKKAHEISVLCEAEVALIVFSNRGKLFEYSTDSCMDKILERYERYSYAERQLTNNYISDDQSQQANWAFDSEKLKAKVELLQRNHRHYLGQDLESLSMKELQSLEHHLDTALKHIRSRKNQLMHESISELQKKEKSMHDQNNLLAKKLKEREETIIAEEVQWQQQTDQHVPLDLSSGFLLSPPLPSLNIGGAYQEEIAADQMQYNNNDLNLTLEPIYSYMRRLPRMLQNMS